MNVTVQQNIKLLERKLAKTILLVDDSASLRQVAKMSLTSAGYMTREASDGLEALKLLDGREVSMVACDLNMPNMNGFEFVKAVKLLSQYKFMPILMLTTEAGLEKMDQGKAAGVRAWMVMPFAPSQLLKAVDKLCP